MSLAIGMFGLPAHHNTMKTVDQHFIIAATETQESEL